MSTQHNNIDIWNTAKRKLASNFERYELCTTKPSILKSIKAIFSSTKKVDNAILRKIWIDTNKQTSILWKDAMKELDMRNSFSINEETYQNGFWDEEQKDALKSLEENGFYIFKKQLGREAINKLTSSLDNELTRPSDSSQQMIDLKVCAKDVIESKQCQYIRWHFDADVFVRMKELEQLTQEPSLLKIAREYLGSETICTNKQAWISKGINQQSLIESSSAAQLYHFDYDSFNFLKVMIYLSDVCTESGPHTFMKTTHKPFKSDEIRKEMHPYGRYNDDQIYYLIDKSNEVKICGNAGTVILVDTSGFHKGQILGKNHTRLMAQIEFVDCGLQFGHKHQKQNG